jgi:hypothetical protein
LEEERSSCSLPLTAFYNITSGPNASAQKPKPLLDGGQRTVPWHQTGMREDYAETTDSGFGLLQHFV